MQYTWVDIGSSCLPSDILAAFLLAQLEAKSRIQTKRKHIWFQYFNQLQNWARDRNIRLPAVPDHCEQSYHMFYILLLNFGRCQSLINHLKSRRILAVFHYLPLHLSEMGVRFGGKNGQCPAGESVSDRILRLPFFTDLSEQEQATVIASILEFD